MELQDIVLPRCLRRGYRDSELPRADRDEVMNHTKELMNDISGEAREGETMAVLGVSGSGKSKLIDALADRIARESLHATVTLNGEVLEYKFLKMISAYVIHVLLLNKNIQNMQQHKYMILHHYS
ncbi:hypothetical protein K7X08_037672 [Anisodus acutangulus]|uniref:ABC transporter domain-containing protein n=1 Tax=Anisodus acutangulus TaxID=402998 RepID=A0A9Q1MXK2_9SOLA|nr:hypothetical protein K7X08_037672 [Anisodus acutangulus]